MAAAIFIRVVSRYGKVTMSGMDETTCSATWWKTVALALLSLRRYEVSLQRNDLKRLRHGSGPLSSGRKCQKAIFWSTWRHGAGLLETQFRSETDLRVSETVSATRIKPSSNISSCQTHFHPPIGRQLNENRINDFSEIFSILSIISP
ncbi:hypothetical protein AVEN_146416-1 [Araneus ventricosus]|uniref:Uncharacterized protein n=1 Tax=Araneus ventricosus TaxID=182803 RepID=A0A4Y2TJA9_ARAVE|nr:hypothetical protein AVEN_197780-1 [Araneus ventricosus]GBO00638.1 hypothetical protein AVEN_146416-1 [Araneus ventricosus]